MCLKCPLAKTRKSIVWGDGPTDTRLVIVGEGPGEAEDELGLPFVGKTGAELDNYLALYTGAPRPEWYTTNVLKCRPPKNRDPKPQEVEACVGYLEEEIRKIKPKLVLALGGFAARALGMNKELEVVHGIPHKHRDGYTLIPCYHPALGLHDTSKMILIQRDFEAVGGWRKGEIKEHKAKEPEKLRIHLVKEWREIPQDIDGVGVDTENTRDGSRLWSMQCSNGGTTALMMLIEGRTWVELGHPSRIREAIFHNSPHDLKMLRTVGIRPDKFRDTMLMAYLLGDEPQSLKALGYRHLGWEMKEYKEVVSPYQADLAVRYLGQVANHKGSIHEEAGKKWSVQKRAKRILSDWYNDNETDMWERWHGIGLAEGREAAEKKWGPMPRACLADVEWGTASQYACLDPRVTTLVEEILRKRIKQYNLGQIMELDLGIIEMLVDMEMYGMPVKEDHLRKLGSDLGVRMGEVEGEIHKMAGYAVNPGSSKQVREMLFKGLGLRSRKKTPGGEDSTGQKYLEMMKNEHPVVEKTLEWRKLEKLKGTYADSLPEKVRNGRIHPKLLYTRTATGRLASKDPNLQNVPVRSVEGRMIRDCFVAPDRMELLSCDYSQIELRVLAHESQDPTMLRVYRSGLDLHTVTASEIFGVPEDQVDAVSQRRPAKTVNFAVVYGISANGLRESLAKEGADLGAWTPDRCEEFIRAWFRLYPGVKNYMDRQELHARRYGFVRDMFGRLRWIPEVKSVHPQIVAAGVRQAGNMGVQSGAAGIMKKAMADLTPVYKRWWNDGITFRPLIQIHDDLVWEVDEDWVEEAYWIVKTMMEGAVELSVPITVEGKRGKQWGTLKSL